MSVSVVLPVYNGEKFLAQAIESVYAQTALPSELIVVDDGSTDASREILRQFEGRPGFQAVRTPNRGPASARNTGIELATGEYIALLDHDDRWRPRKLERQLAEFDREWGMSFTAFEFTTPTGSELRRHDNWDPDPQAVIRQLERWNAIGPPATVLIRRSALERVGGFESAAHGEDWLMWLRLAAAGYRIGYLPEPLTEYLWHGANRSSDEPADHLNTACQVFDLYGEPRLRAWWRLLAAIDAHEHKNRQLARRRLFEAARIRPLSIRPGWLKLLF